MESVYKEKQVHGDYRKGRRLDIAFCAEIPETNGQGRTVDEALVSLDKAITLVLEDAGNR